MIPKKDYIAVGKALAVEEQTAINHTACKAGEDKKNRLFIKNTGTAIIAYCHNCQDKGYHALTDRLEGRRDKLPHKSIEMLGAVEDIMKHPDVPHMVSIQDIAVSTEVIDWLPESLKTPTGRVKIVYNKRTNRPILPIGFYNPYENGCFDYSGWQERKVYNDSRDTNPLKYVTVRAKGTPNWCEFHNAEDETKSLVITEDIASAAHIYNSAGVSTIALMCTTASQKMILEVAQRYKRAVVWLDPDEAGIEGAKTLTERLRLFMPIFRMHKNVLEAKTFSTEELSEWFKAITSHTDWNSINIHD